MHGVPSLPSSSAYYHQVFDGLDTTNLAFLEGGDVTILPGLVRELQNARNGTMIVSLGAADRKSVV